MDTKVIIETLAQQKYFWPLIACLIAPHIIIFMEVIVFRAIKMFQSDKPMSEVEVRLFKMVENYLKPIAAKIEKLSVQINNYIGKNK